MATIQRNSPERDFSDFLLEASLKFSMNCFNLSSFFLLREDYSPTAAASSSSKVLKTEPLSPIATGLDFAYASDVPRIIAAIQYILLNFRVKDCGFLM
jgi:hypothetical protein